MIWRKTNTITSKLKDYINEHVISYQDTHNLFLETLLLITSNPKHLFNANFLHKHLMGFSLPDRDAFWTIYINGQFGATTPVKRLVDWAWSEEDKTHLSDDSIFLSAKTLSWFLTSSNRFLRDSATKSLISLLENSISILIQVLKEFDGVSDPYVYERLYAVAYGCAIRTKNREALKGLCVCMFIKPYSLKILYIHIFY